MAEITAVAEQTPLDRTSYLERFTSAGETDDRTNIETLIQRFEDVTDEQGITGNIYAVGGTLKKNLPRKDIDLLITAEKIGSAIPPTGLERFGILKELVGKMVNGTKIRIQETQEPVPHPEYGHLGAMQRDGVIKLTPEKGVPIEIISAEPAQEAPSVLLSKAI